MEQRIFVSYAIWNKALNVRHLLFQRAGAIDPEPKQMEYFIFWTPFALLLLYDQLVEIWS